MHYSIMGWEPVTRAKKKKKVKTILVSALNVTTVYLIHTPIPWFTHLINKTAAQKCCHVTTLHNLDRHL